MDETPAAPPRDGPDREHSLDGPALARALRAGADALGRQADALNAINVFPVPDGDTGTNMALTMRAAVEGIADETSIASVMEGLARGSLMGAKGNSGVILSQMLIGAARALEGRERLDAASLAEGLAAGRDAAYGVMSQPREGTILTAIAAAASAAGAADSRAGTVETLEAVVAATRDAVERTPEMLPLLKDAGVVDAGAQGLYVLLRGALTALTDGADESLPAASIDPAWLAATRRAHGSDGASRGYCTQFVVTRATATPEDVRARMHELGDSVLVVGDGRALRVHLHTDEPETAFAFGRTLGEVADEQADDMTAQFAQLARNDAQRTGAHAAGAAVAVVAVATGGGIVELMRAMGAWIVPGGATMNPSAGEIRAAIEGTGARSVIVLPNHRNIVLAARQARDGLDIEAQVVETASIPEGIAALVAFNAEAPFEANVRGMRAAIAGVRSGEVTVAARDTRLGSLEVRAGQPIGLVNGDLACTGETIAEAVLECIERMAAAGAASLVTLYFGDGADRTEAVALADAIAGRFRLDVEIVDGGQPHYPYLFSVE